MSNKYLHLEHLSQFSFQHINIYKNNHLILFKGFKTIIQLKLLNQIIFISSFNKLYVYIYTHV